MSEYKRIVDDREITRLRKERDRYREALEQIARFGVCFDAKGTRSKQINELARAALHPKERDDG